MAFPESSHSSIEHLSPVNIAFQANSFWEERKSGRKAGGAISRDVAVALVMKEEGASILRKTLSGFEKKDGTAPDMRFVLSGLNPDQSEEFSYGLGEAVLGSILESIGDVVFFRNWDDQVFLDRFNQAFTGTPIEKMTLSDLNINNSSRQKIATEETVIRKAIAEKKSIAGFVKLPLNMEPLPQVVRILLREGMSDFLFRVIPTYEQALKAL